MKRNTLVAVLAAAALALLPMRARAGGPDATVFVDAKWVMEHLKDPDVVVLHVASLKRDYVAGHIPGARYLWTGSMAMGNPDMSFEVLPVPQLKDALEAAGVSNNSRVIICGVQGNVSPTARVLLTFEYLGMGDRTSILDGGFEAWKAAGGEVSTEVPKVERVSFTPHVKKEVFVDADWVNGHLHTSGVTVVDARAPQFYNGQSAGQPRAGRIPGAKNLYYLKLVDTTNKILAVPRLRELFDSAGVQPGQELVTYCHVGQTASLVYVTARYLGYNVHLYDGSFDDWSTRMDLPVELPEKKDSTGGK